MGCLKYRQGASVRIGLGENRKAMRGKKSFTGFVYKWIGKNFIRTRKTASGKSGNTQGEVKG